jgi:protein-tyrosine-phosphatase
MELEQRARVFRALGDETRLRIVDALFLNDITPAELVREIGAPSNLIAHHLAVLEEAGLLLRHTSEGDRRRRYLSLVPGALRFLPPHNSITARSVLFVCTHNSARSQFAEAALRARSDLTVQSAGTTPAHRLSPKAVSAAAAMGLALENAHPKPYDQVQGTPDLVISVCDRAREASNPFDARRLHWSVPDPITANRIDGFRDAFAVINDRIDDLVDAIEQGGRA